MRPGRSMRSVQSSLPALLRMGDGVVPRLLADGSLRARKLERIKEQGRALS